MEIRAFMENETFMRLGKGTSEILRGLADKIDDVVIFSNLLRESSFAKKADSSIKILSQLKKIIHIK